MIVADHCIKVIGFDRSSFCPIQGAYIMPYRPLGEHLVTQGYHHLFKEAYNVAPPNTHFQNESQIIANLLICSGQTFLHY